MGASELHGGFDVAAGRLGEPFVVRPAGDLNQAASAEMPTVPGLGVPISQTVAVNLIRQLLGFECACVCRIHSREALWPDLSQPAGAVIQVFLQAPEAAAFYRALPYECGNPAGRRDFSLAQRSGEAR